MEKFQQRKRPSVETSAQLKEAALGSRAGSNADAIARDPGWLDMATYGFLWFSVAPVDEGLTEADEPKLRILLEQRARI